MSKHGPIQHYGDMSQGDTQEDLGLSTHASEEKTQVYQAAAARWELLE